MKKQCLPVVRIPHLPVDVSLQLLLSSVLQGFQHFFVCNLKYLQACDRQTWHLSQIHHSRLCSVLVYRSKSVIDKSLDLEKFSRRNDSYFSLSSWRIVFSFLFLFSIFKIFRQQISFFSRFARFLKSILFLFSIFKIVKTKVSFYSRFMRLCSLFLFLFLWEMLHIFGEKYAFSGFEVLWKTVM